MTYGGYQLGDVLADAKLQELGRKDIKVIDGSVPREQYYASSEGSSAKKNLDGISDVSNLASLFTKSGLDPKILSYGTNIPKELYQVLNPIMDINSKAFKDAKEKLSSAALDLALTDLNATNQSEKAASDYNYGLWQKDLDRLYGISVSDNATKAWTQLENLDETHNQRGIQGSGMEQDVVDDYLRSVRKTNYDLTQSHLSSEEAKLASQMTASGTSAQIKALIEEDKAKGIPQSQWRVTKWGLIPDSTTAEAYSMNTLKKMFPEKTEAELQDYRNAHIDENGNLRSTLYSKYYSDVRDKKIASDAGKTTTVLQNALNKEATAYSPFTGVSPFSQPTDAELESQRKTAENQPKTTLTPLELAKTTPTVPGANTNNALIGKNFGTPIVPPSNPPTLPGTPPPPKTPTPGTLAPTTSDYLKKGNTNLVPSLGSITSPKTKTY
jgi:hypothetical protein